MIDILITESGDGGDLSLINNDLVASENFESMIYLALFGGNIQSDNGEQNNDWWANSIVPSENSIESNFEKTINQIVINSSGISKLEEAAKKDLEFLKKYANYSLEIKILKKDSLSLYITISKPNNVSQTVNVLWNAGNVTITSYVI